MYAKILEELYYNGTYSIVGTLKILRITRARHVWRSKGVIGQITTWTPNAKKRPKDKDGIKDGSRDIRSKERGKNCKRQGGMNGYGMTDSKVSKRSIKCRRRKSRVRNKLLYRIFIILPFSQKKKKFPFSFQI